MTLPELIRQASADGVTLSLSDCGTVKAAGNPAAVERWLPAIREHKAGIVRAISEAPASRWLIHFPDRTPLKVAFSSEATHTEVLALYPDATAAETCNEVAQGQTSTLTDNEVRRVRAWLASIGETDPATIQTVIDRCGHDEDARDYFTGRAPEVPAKEVQSCVDCRHARRPGGAVRYCASGRDDLPPAYGAGHPLRRLPADAGAGINSKAHPAWP